MPRITIIELYGYKEWTETLGPDREWIIQSTQARFYELLQKLFSKHNGFVFPLRYDYYIALSNGISIDIHRELYSTLTTSSPVPIRMASVPHPYPLIAQLIATRKLASSHQEFVFMEGDEDPVVILHIDLNNITSMTYDTSVYETYSTIIKIFSMITETTMRYGGIANYLGGDNILAVLPLKTYKEYINVLPDYVKVGIGISYRPRRALELATKALDEIRSKRQQKFIIYSESSEA